MRSSYCALVMSLAAPAGFAESDGPARSGWLEEVVVTAQKRATDIQDVALAVSAISGESLERGQIRSVDDLQFSVPGMTFSTFSANAQLTIRGSGAEDLNVGGDGGSGFHFDGIYQGRPYLLNQGFFDVERVEVLRGPQGTLLGRNNTGGSLNVISRKPVMDEFEVYGDVTGGNYDYGRARAAVNLPLVSETLAARIAVESESRDGWLYNETRREYQEDTRTRAGRVHLLYTPTDAFSATLSAYRFKNEGSGPIRQTPVDISAISGASPEPSSLRRVRSDGRAPGDRPDMSEVIVELETEGYAAELEWALGSMTLKSITGAFRSTSDGDTDTDETDRSLQFSNRKDTAQQYSQEFQLISELDGPLNFVVGLFGFEEESRLDLDSVRALLGPDSEVTAISTLLVDHTVDTTSYAVFGEAYYDLTDALRLTLGARYSHDEKEGSGQPLVGTVTSLEEDWSEFTPRIGLDYTISDDTMVYLTVSKGYKSGGMNTVPAFNSYKPETLWSYEAGLKTDFWDGRARTNLALFYNEVKDQHFFRAIPNQTLGFTVDNAGESTIYGAELEGQFAVTEAFTLDLNLAYLDAEFDEFLTIDPGTPSDTTIISLAGNRLPRAPEFTGSLAAEYQVALNNGYNLNAKAQYRYQSEIWFSHFNERQLYSRQGGYGKADLFLTLEDPTQSWYVQGFVKNVTDKDTVANAFRNQSVFGELVNQSFHYASPPRTYGLTVGFTLQ